MADTMFSNVPFTIESQNYLSNERLVARREALNGHRYSVTFYGAWYVIDNHSSRAYSADSIEQAVHVAERGNTTEV